MEGNQILNKNQAQRDNIIFISSKIYFKYKFKFVDVVEIDAPWIFGAQATIYSIALVI